jgi:hypothetical protein
MPFVGTVDFTETGARLWLELSERLSDDPDDSSFAYTDVVREKRIHYYRTRAKAVEELNNFMDEEGVISVRGPFPTGPWRAQWWRRFPEGYRIEIEDYRPWQGRGSGGGETCFLDRKAGLARAHSLRDILDRHNVTIAEWVAATSMEDGPQQPEGTRFASRLSELANRGFGLAISAEECGKAIEACLRQGWLRVIDRNVYDEIRALLHIIPAHLAVPRKAVFRTREYWWGPEGLDNLLQGKPSVPSPTPIEHRWGEIDFSRAGAELYRTISAEWLGPDWDDNLSVSNGIYWEEHRYSESDAGFEYIMQEHVARGAVIHSSRVVPIGPWCVYWWEQFPAGYRLELKLGNQAPQGAGLDDRDFTKAVTQ